MRSVSVSYKYWIKDIEYRIEVWKVLEVVICQELFFAPGFYPGLNLTPASCHFKPEWNGSEETLLMSLINREVVAAVCCQW